MTISWLIRFVLVWLWMLIHGADPTTCERVWDMSPRSTLPQNKTYEEWYGSPALICDSVRPHYAFWYCLGPNC